MQYSKPTQELVHEHETISGVLEAIEAVAGAKASWREFPQEFFEKALDFLATFADQCHHGKEETHLFPLLETRGVARDGGPLGVMLGEHAEGRAHIAAAREALRRSAEGNPVGGETVRAELLAYAALLRRHIFKENAVLFPLADQVMTAEDKVELWRKFQCVEHDLLPPGAHEKYVALAQELRATAGL